MRALLFILVVAVTSCKKNYTCRCSNPGGVYATYEIKDTKSKAEKTCAKYGPDSSVPMSESYCSIK